jgi:RNA polymerase sigma-70 factor (ECF subfamily)
MSEAPACSGGPKPDLDRLRRQDERAFADLVATCQPMVAGICQSMGLAGPDLDDALAEAFANVYRALPGFAGESQISTWVYRIAWRSILKVHKRYKSRRWAELPQDHLDSAQRPPGEAGEIDETNRRIWDAVARLEPRQSAAVEMFYRQSMGVEEIAGVLECPIGTVKTLLFRARAALKDVLMRQEIVP